MTEDVQPQEPGGAAKDAAEPGVVRAGTDDFYVEARGRFQEKDVSGYVPSPESEKLRVALPLFEGPLDLLLYLIDKHALDIFDIPISRITEEYLKILDDMRALDLDVAGEFLVMAARLAHIKSKMLLPKEEREEEGEEEGTDPRADLVRRLLEYQRFKHAANELAERHWLGRDVFLRPEQNPGFLGPHPDDVLGLGLMTFDVMDLIKVLDKILKRTKKKVVHEVFVEQMNVSARINELVDFARERAHFTFEDALTSFGGFTRQNVIVTFLSILEMARLKLVRVHQPDMGGAIYITPIPENLNADGAQGGSLEGIDYSGAAQA